MKMQWLFPRLSPDLLYRGLQTSSEQLSIWTVIEMANSTELGIVAQLMCLPLSGAQPSPQQHICGYNGLISHLDSVTGIIMGTEYAPKGL